MECLSRPRRARKAAAATLSVLLLVVWEGALHFARAQTFKTVGDDNYYISYYDVATSSAAAASGFGGPGHSGGAGDGIMRIVNPTSNDTIQSGTLCAMTYVFDDIEEMQTCCGCPVSADGMSTSSVIRDLIGNFGVHKGTMSAGVVDVISAKLNFTVAQGVLQPDGIFCAPGTAGCCDPTGGGLNGKARGTGTPISPVSGLRAWMTHTEKAAGTSGNFGFVSGVSVDEFERAPLDGTHLSELQSQCAFLLQNSSGAGLCFCGDPQMTRCHEACLYDHYLDNILCGASPDEVGCILKASSKRQACDKECDDNPK